MDICNSFHCFYFLWEKRRKKLNFIDENLFVRHNRQKKKWKGNNNMEKNFAFQGYTFEDEKQLLAAKKEAEAIEYLRSKTDFTNLNQLLNLYNRILDRDMMETAIGIAFLEEIRGILVNSGMFKEEQLRSVPLPKEKKKEKKREEVRKRTREAILLEQNKKELLRWKIVCFFLSFLVVGMFVIVLTGVRSPLAIRYEKDILNKYSSWAEELQKKEDLLGEYLRQLEQAGIDIPEFVQPEADSE